jgi:NTP pyrophosphatase (non-canonical NTP hydrolase)
VIGTLHHELDSPSMTGADVTGQTFQILCDVARERQRQDAKWGEQSYSPEWWLAILTEEVGEAAQEVLGIRFGDAAKAHGDMRTELLHVAAVAVSAIESLDYGSAGLGRT